MSAIAKIELMFLLCMSMLPLSVCAQNADSVLAALAAMPDGVKKLESLEYVGKNHVSVDTVIKYSQLELALAQKLDSARYVAFANDNLAWAWHCKLDFSKSMKCRLEAIDMWDSLGFKNNLAFSYMNYATALLSSGNSILADEYYKNSLEIFSQLADTAHIARVLQYLGLLSLDNMLYDDSEDYYRKSLKLNLQTNDTRGIALDYSGLADIAIAKLRQQDIGTSTDLLQYAKNMALAAYKFALQTDDNSCKLTVLPKLCEVYIAESKINSQRSEELLDSCLYYYRKGIEIENEYGYDFAHIYLQTSYISYLILKKDFAMARQILKQTESEILSYDDDVTNLPMLYQANIDYNVATGNYLKAFEYSEKKYKDLLLENGKNNQSKLLQTKYQTEYSLKMKERIQAERERELWHQAREDSQRQVAIIFIAAFLLMSVLAIIIFVNSLRRKHLNRQLDAKNHQLESVQSRLFAQNKIINQANKNITSSIRYARHIQEVAMPSKEMMNAIFGDCLIIYRPRDIVSGDFYWATEVGRYKAFAVADCTGHGVPGAFLSMLGISMLSDMVATMNMNTSNISASMLLNLLRTNFRKALRQSFDDYTNQDGMDIAFCLFDIRTRCLQYAGAFRPLLLVRNNEIVQYDADRMPIGAFMQLNKPFSNNIIDIEDGDVIYLYTDGITDQFNTDDDPLKFTAPRLRKLILENHHLAFSQQQIIYEQKIDSWRTSPKTHQVIHQNDDMLMLGIRF